MGLKRKFSTWSVWPTCSTSMWTWRGAMATTICGNRRPEISQGKLQSAVLGMVVIANRECDIDRISCQKRTFDKAFGHVPAESIEDNLRPQVRSGFPVLGAR